MNSKTLIWIGLGLIAVAFGLMNSRLFVSRYVQSAQGPRAFALQTVPPEYFSLVVEPDAGLAPVLSKIEHASASVDLVMYEMSDQQIEEALKSAVVRGVAVRVLLNGGYYDKHEQQNEAMFERLQAEGVPVRWTPTRFALTHQKTLVVDGGDALIMTFNFQPKYYKTGRDFAIDDTNPTDVAAIEQTFDADWNGSGDALPGDDLLWSPGAKDETLALISSATSTLDIYNEEMNDADVEQALVLAAHRGVRVRLDMTYATNWKPELTALARGGAEVRTYASSSKIRYIHAKAIIVDGARAFVGSQNFSNGSLSSNRELGIILMAPGVIHSLESVFESDWAGARPFVAGE